MQGQAWANIALEFTSFMTIIGVCPSFSANSSSALLSALSYLIAFGTAFGLHSLCCLLDNAVSGRALPKAFVCRQAVSQANLIRFDGVSTPFSV